MAQAPRRILLVRTDRMGDLLMSLPAASAIRRALPTAQISLLVRKEFQPLLEGHPDVSRLLALPEPGEGGWLASLRIARWLRPFRFDAALILNPTRFFHLTCFLAGIPLRIGYRRKWGFLLTRSIQDTKHLRSLHETEYNLELARELGIPTDRPVLSLPERPEARTQAVQLLESHGVRLEEARRLVPGETPPRAPARPVAVHPWTSSLAKSWPVESFMEVVRNLAGQGRTVLLIGQAAGAEPPRPHSGRVVDLCGKTPLRVLPELLRLCSVLLTNDSGPAHVAAAVGTPTLVVAPSQHERQMRRWRPLGEAHRILLSPTVEQVLAALRAGASGGASPSASHC